MIPALHQELIKTIGHVYVMFLLSPWECRIIVKNKLNIIIIMYINF